MKEQQGIFWVSHSQYWIADGFGIDSLTLATYRSDNGLVEIVTENLAVIFTGTEAGSVDLRVQWHDGVPARGDDGEWDEIVEFSLEFEDDEIGGISSLDDAAGQFSSVPELAGAGWYRFRLHARGRDFAHEVITVTGTPREEHLLQVWPAPHADVAILKLTDKLGERMRTC